MPRAKPPVERGKAAAVAPGAPPRARGARDLERVRGALIQCALETYEDALARGLCAEGAWEAAVGAMRKLQLDESG